MRHVSIYVLTILFALPIAACGPQGADARAIVAPAPIEFEGSGYGFATKTPLPERKPEDSEGLHQVFRLSDNIISGAEPVGEVAFRRLAAMGVKTILSVDGKTPDAAIARKYGMRYVHVPIQYKGITEDQILQIAKTFRELEAPFYVHCFHGKHRGPAAAAIGSVALDGLDRDTAIAEMRQWCSTAQKYEGLYATVATADIPTAAETAAFDFDFTSSHRFTGMRDAMITLTRSWDEVKPVSYTHLTLPTKIV